MIANENQPAFYDLMKAEVKPLILNLVGTLADKALAKNFKFQFSD